MKHPIFTAVADDDTGATDLAGMLAGHGLRTILVIDIPDPAAFERWTQGADAVILGAGTRALTPAQAYDLTRAGVRLAASLSPRVIEIKYCSTFDSTEEGNIGPSLDAAMDELGETFTVALPALPVNGRTTFMGHHFVYQQLLSDSPMRHHPLTPMRNPNLVTHLQAQTRRKVGLAAHPVTRDALERLRAAGVEIAILDCVSDADLTNVCEAIADLRLISGSSAPAMKLPAIWRRNGWWEPTCEGLSLPETGGRGCLIAAGSCSVATRGQNAWIESQGATVVVVDPLALAQDEPCAAAESKAVETLEAGGVCLLKTASQPEDVARVQAWAGRQGLSVNETGLRIAYGLARLVRRVVEQRLPSCLIVAGGETAGAVCRTLELGALEVGRNIEPGVPLCVSLGRFRLPVVLKSGNFGSPDFYGRARQAATRTSFSAPPTAV
jgi:uncharacterized protein YgbK (DUF1537 family)